MKLLSTLLLLVPLLSFAGDYVPIERKFPHNDGEGTFIVDVTINGKFTVPMMIDSGAADMGITDSLHSVLVLMGDITLNERLESRGYILAGGEDVEYDRVMLHSVQVGNTIMYNVPTSVKPAEAAMVILGQSFLGRLTYWGIDNQANTLLMGDVIK